MKTNIKNLWHERKNMKFYKFSYMFILFFITMITTLFATRYSVNAGPIFP